MIYLMQNTETGQAYVGSTDRTLVDEWEYQIKKSRGRSTHPLYKAIRHYGTARFSMKELSNDRTVEAWIERYNAIENGYNLPTPPVHVVSRPLEVCERIASTLKQACTDELRDKMRKVHTGAKRSVEARQKMSRAWTEKRRREQSERLTSANRDAASKLHDYTCASCGREFKGVKQGTFGAHRRVCKG